MEKNTPMYMMIMVGMVALVAIVYMLTKPAAVQTGLPNTPNLPPTPNSMISGNVVAEDIAPVDLSGVGRFLFGAALLGTCVYAYKKW